MTTRKASWTDYLLVYGLLAVSGMEYYYRPQQYSFILFAIVLGVVWFRKPNLTVRPLLIIAVVFLLEMLHALHFNNFVPTSLATILVRLTMVYLVVHTCGLRFIRCYIDILYVSALLSLPVWALTFFPAAEQFLIQNVAQVLFRPLIASTDSLYSHNPNIIIYTFNPFAQDLVGSVLVKRNSGPFWEPGAFGIFLNLALVFNIIRKKALINRENVWMAIALFTTLSTAGYLTLFIILIGYLLASPAIRPIVKISWMVVMIPVGVIAYSQMAFLGGKVEENISLTREDNSSRFGSAYLDFVDLARSPVIGFGRLIENRFGQLARSHDLAVHRNNGITNLLVTYGIPATVAYLWLVFLFFRRYCRRAGCPQLFALFGFLSVMSSAFSQVVLDRPVLLALLFLAERLRQIERWNLPAGRRENPLTVAPL
ncbi:hypothetical protein [Larkinella soli]|uniref:hypothetical protein n=1 Tax=Larkinella soli TaxID=1770527 RepID=UPI000FFBCF7E|nr:hypothetical protein [Larkinella soli]